MTRRDAPPATRLDQPGDAPLSVPRLVGRFLTTGLVALVVVAVVTALVSRALGTREAIADAIRLTSVVATTAIEPALADGIRSGDPEALENLDRVVREQVVRGSLVRVKLWATDGTILYSDEPRLIGQHYDLDEDDLEAIESGAASADVSDLTEPENKYEEPAKKLLEVYQPVYTPDGQPLLLEAYYAYSGVVDAGRTAWLRFAPYTLGALLLLELLQIPIAISLASRLRRTQTQREALLYKALEATDEERRRIASDLHDGVVQDLSGVAFSLGGLAREVEPESDVATEVRGSAERVREAVRSLRSLLVEIYPPNLADEGLPAALSDLAAGLSARGIAVRVDVDPVARELPLDAAQIVYRAAQEALRNVISHAQASAVDIRVREAESGVLRLEVEDNGRGFDTVNVPERPGHLGLRALAGVARDSGAVLTVRSRPGEGTVLTLDVPMAERVGAGRGAP